MILRFKESSKLEVYICKPQESEPTMPFVQKCCEYDEVYSLGMNGKRGGCLKLDPLLNETFWSPTFYDDLNKPMDNEQMKQLHPHIIHMNPTSFKPLCKDGLTTVFPYGQEVVNFLNRVLKRSLMHLP